MLSWLFPWRRCVAARPVHVTLVSRQGCHLCDEARVQLQAAGQRYSVVLQVIDVDSDAELVKRYGECVPLILVEGRVRFKGRINPVLLTRLLRAKTRSKTP